MATFSLRIAIDSLGHSGVDLGIRHIIKKKNKKIKDKKRKKNSELQTQLTTERKVNTVRTTSTSRYSLLQHGAYSPHICCLSNGISFSRAVLQLALMQDVLEHLSGLTC